MRHVTRKQAQTVLSAVESKYDYYIDALYPEGGQGRPRLMPDWDGHEWVILWEEGPFEWTYDPLMSPSIDEETSSLVGYSVQMPASKVKLPAGVWTEAINHYSIAIYRE